MERVTEMYIYALLVVTMISLSSCQTTSSSGLCEASRNCRSCISAHPDCVWCSNPFHPDGIPRCVDPSSSSVNCSEHLINVQSKPAITKDANFSVPDNGTTGEIIQMRPQNLTVKLRKGQTLKVNVTFRKVIDYPLDLYYVMDLSNSMNDDLQTLKNLGDDLVNGIKRNITDNVQVGFGSFVDKVMMPYTSTVLAQLENPCNGGVNMTTCAPPFGFRHQLAITGNATAFKEAVSGTEVSGNIDIPEGSFDALMQIAVCEEHIKWRPGSMRVILLTTDATPHIAMDGKLAAILEANDMKCHLEAGGNVRLGANAVVYTKSKTLDYPSLGQLKEVFTQNKIRTIFAVTNDVYPLYKEIPKVLKELGEVSELADDSRNIIPLIETTYNKIKGRLVVRASDAPSHVSFTQKTYCPAGVVNDGAMDCNNINLGDEVIFELSFTANECLDQKDQIRLTSSSVSDVVTINLEYICDCECEAHDVANSSHCNNYGNVTCGLCSCEKGREGSRCQCESNSEKPLSDQCKLPDSEKGLCEDRGMCECGDCMCNKGYNGSHCQCETTGCPTSNQKQCGGEDNGWCNNCPGIPESQKCVCHNGYTTRSSDNTCTCHDKFCKAEGEDRKCTGRGECECDTCVCNEPDKWEGKYCDKCIHPDCTNITASCDDPLIKACAACRSKSGSSDCESVCPTKHPFLLVNAADSLPTCDCSSGSTSDECKGCSKHDSSISVPATCERYFEDSCSYFFKMYWTTEDRFYVYVKSYNRETDCPKPVEAIVIILPTVGAVVLIGLILLILWKLYTTRRDRIAWEEFEEERKRSKWTQGENPIFETPENKFTNPMFDADHDE